MSLKHSNISIFVPHIGCTNMCSFCNQRYITGKVMAPQISDIDSAVKTALGSGKINPDTTEIAFFGGSFTAIDRSYMLDLLKAASYYVNDGTVKGIRISTRPDAIDDEILNILKDFKVTAIELGAQSMNDNVLKKNNRGHTAADVVRASKLIKEYGFELGLQMMTGLYCDTDEFAISTAEKIISLAPQTVRIYPTIVLKDTNLADMYYSGKYAPQTLKEAIKLSAKLYCMFTNAGIKVIRLGLHSIEENAYVAGPWHPAFSELCQSEIMLNSVKKELEDKGNYIIYVSKSSVSKMIGQSRKNISELKKCGYNVKVIADSNLSGLEFKIEREVE